MAEVNNNQILEDKIDKLTEDLKEALEEIDQYDFSSVRKTGQESEKRRKFSTLIKEDRKNSIASVSNASEIIDFSSDRKTSTVFGVCPECSSPIESEASVVGQLHYHPQCFVCCECKEPLGTSTYYIFDGKNYCAKDREALLEKCHKCGEMIDGDLIRPDGQKGDAYHPNCFRCSDCRREIRGRFYEQDGKIICEEDYAATRDKCWGCDQPVVGQILKALNRTYHPGCFTCSSCPLNLDGIQFYVSKTDSETGGADPMCQTCYSRSSAKKCRGCEEAILEDYVVSTIKKRNENFVPGGNSGGSDEFSVEELPYHKDCYHQKQKGIA